MQPKPSVIFTKMLNVMENSILWGSKVINPSPLRQKKNWKFFGLKAYTDTKIKVHAQFLADSSFS